MIKQSIKLVGCIIALFALILVFKHSHLMQEEKPLNTTERFNIAVLSTTISKERLVNELNALVDQYGAVLVKVVPNQDNYDSQKDIIWFGSLQPDGTSPRIRDNRISWLEPSVGGELIHSSDMGVRPLYGSYSMLGSTEFKVALAEWCNKNEMSIDFYKQYPLPAVFLVYFIQHGIGNAVLISFFLFLTTVIVWFVTHAKARALRLLGGVPLQRIHFEDTLTIISLTSQGFFVGCAAFFIYLGIASGIDQLSVMFLPFIYTAITFITISAVVVLLISLFVQPKAKHLSFRKIPLKQFRLLGRAALIFSIVLALMVVPTTITIAKAAPEERREKAEHLRVIPEKKPKTDKESARSGTKRQQEVYATIDKSYEDMKDSKRVTEDSALVSLRYTARNMVETCDVLFTNFPGLLEKPDYKDQVIEIMQEPKQYILKLEGETDNEQHENTLQADGGQQPGFGDSRCVPAQAEYRACGKDRGRVQ